LMCNTSSSKSSSALPLHFWQLHRRLSPIFIISLIFPLFNKAHSNLQALNMKNKDK
jgi:hypothetical protein